MHAINGMSFKISIKIDYLKKVLKNIMTIFHKSLHDQPQYTRRMKQILH